MPWLAHLLVVQISATSQGVAADTATSIIHYFPAGTYIPMHGNNVVEMEDAHSAALLLGVSRYFLDARTDSEFRCSCGA